MPRDRLTIAQRQSVRDAAERSKTLSERSLDQIMSDYYRRTYPMPYDEKESDDAES